MIIKVREQIGDVGKTNADGKILIIDEDYNTHERKYHEKNKWLKNGKYIIKIPNAGYIFKDEKGNDEEIYLKSLEKTIIVKGSIFKPDKKIISISLKKDQSYMIKKEV